MGRFMFLLLSASATAWVAGYARAMIDMGRGSEPVPAWALWFGGVALVALVTSTILVVIKERA